MGMEPLGVPFFPENKEKETSKLTRTAISSAVDSSFQIIVVLLIFSPSSSWQHANYFIWKKGKIVQTLSCLKFLACVNNKYIIIGRPGSFLLLLKNCLAREISVSSQLMKEFALSCIPFSNFLFPSWGGGSCSESRSLLSLKSKRRTVQMFEEMLVTVPFYPLLRLQSLPVASTTEATSHCLWTLSVLSLLTCSSTFTLSSIAYFPASFQVSMKREFNLLWRIFTDVVDGIFHS